MNKLEQLLLRLRKELPPGNETDVDTLVDIAIMDIGFAIGSDKELWECDDGTSANLPEDLKNYFHAVCYIQCVVNFLGEVGSDGLLSVFYNRTGASINALRSLLKQFNDELEPLVNQAYELLLPIYEIEPHTNFVTKNPNVDPYKILPNEVSTKIENIESKIEALHDDSFQRALKIYTAAAI